MSKEGMESFFYADRNGLAQIGRSKLVTIKQLTKKNLMGV